MLRLEPTTWSEANLCNHSWSSSWSFSSRISQTAFAHLIASIKVAHWRDRYVIWIKIDNLDKRENPRAASILKYTALRQPRSLNLLKWSCAVSWRVEGYEDLHYLFRCVATGVSPRSARVRWPVWMVVVPPPLHCHPWDRVLIVLDESMIHRTYSVFRILSTFNCEVISVQKLWQGSKDTVKNSCVHSWHWAV